MSQSTEPPSATLHRGARPEPESLPDGEVLDLRGEVCPYTFVFTKLRLEQMAIGDILAVLVDHEPAVRNVPRSAREWGQAVEAVEPAEPGVWRIVLRKTAG